MDPAGRRIVGPGRLDLMYEVTQVLRAAVHLDGRAPHLYLLAPEDAPIARPGVAKATPVAIVLGRRAIAQIPRAVVEAVVVDVVASDNLSETPQNKFAPLLLGNVARIWREFWARERPESDIILGCTRN